MTDQCPKCPTGKLKRVRDISTGYEDHLRCSCGWFMLIPGDPSGRLEAAELLEQMQIERKVLHKAVEEKEITPPPPAEGHKPEEKTMSRNYRGTCPTCKRPDVLMATADKCHRCRDRVLKGKDPVTGEKLVGGGCSAASRKDPARDTTGPRSATGKADHCQP